MVSELYLQCTLLICTVGHDDDYSLLKLNIIATSYSYIRIIYIYIYIIIYNIHIYLLLMHSILCRFSYRLLYIRKFPDI